MLAGFLLNGYQTAIPELAPFANLTWFGWTADHIPLADQFDWASLAIVALVTVVLLIAGVEAFARRDVGAGTALPGPRLPRLHARPPRTPRSGQQRAVPDRPGVGRRPRPVRARHRQLGPIVHRADRRFADVRAGCWRRSSRASTWGRSAGSCSSSSSSSASSSPGSPPPALVGGWVSDERSGRMEMLLPTPVARSRWPLAGGIAVFAAIGVLVAVTAAGIAIGAASAGGEVWTPVLGTAGDRPVRWRPWPAWAWRSAASSGPRLAAPAVVAIDARDVADRPALAATSASLTRFTQLALSSHMGQPMVGVWDPVGHRRLPRAGDRRPGTRSLGIRPAGTSAASRASPAASSRG